MPSIQEKIAAHKELLQKLAERHATLLQEIRNVELQHTATNARLSLLEEMQKEEGDGTIVSELPSPGDGKANEILNRRNVTEEDSDHSSDNHPDIPRE